MRQRMVTVRCECADPGCPVHAGASACPRPTVSGAILYRVDMADRDGTRMCGACAADAFASGLFK